MKHDTHMIQMKLEEIKNAEKQLKIVEKEVNFLEKKEARLKDPDYIHDLEEKIASNKRKMEELQRDNDSLRKQQKKTERLIAKKEKYVISHPD